MFDVVAGEKMGKPKEKVSPGARDSSNVVTDEYTGF